MNAAALYRPRRRFLFALALSLFAHAAALWLPYVRLPHEMAHLPPLTARLEPRTKPATPESKSVEAVPLVADANKGTVPASTVPAVDSMHEMEKSSAEHVLPMHAQLDYVVYEGAAAARTGVVRHRLDIEGQNYVLRSTRQADGLLLDKQVSQLSQGIIDEQGLRPRLFREEEVIKGKKRKREVIFDRKRQRLRYASGSEAGLPPDAQDILSFMYQLAQIPMRQEEFFTLQVSDGARLEELRVEIGSEESIATPVGELRALHLRKAHELGEPYFEIWLGVEFHMLPVKFRSVDASGVTIEEFSISDIRSSDR